MKQPEIGIEDNARKAVADALARTLAETYALYQKTHLYHWNVEGPRFIALHTLFETQYRDLWSSLDVLAERIRAIGSLAPSHSQMAKLAQQSSGGDGRLSEDEMIEVLLTGNEAVVRAAREGFEIADQAGDQASADLLTQRMAAGEKAAWMLRAHLPATA